MTTLTLLCFVVVVSIYYFTYKDIVLEKTHYNMMGYFGWILIFIYIVSWKKVTGEYLSIYMLFAAFLFLFCYGQALFYPFNVIESVRDVFNSYWASADYLFPSEYFSLLCFVTFHFGAIMIVNEKAVLRTHDVVFAKDSTAPVQSTVRNKAILQAGVICAIISAVPFAIMCYYNFKAVQSSGYGQSILYDANSLNRIITILDNIFVPSLFCIYIQILKKKKLKLLFLASLALIVLFQLHIGTRGNAMVIVLGLVLIEHFYVKPFKGKRLLAFIIVSYLALVTVSGIGKIRTLSNRDFQGTINAIFSSFVNVDYLFETITMFGKQIQTLMKTMEIVPSEYPYRYGTGYLWGTTTIIPNLGFWDVHPADAYAGFDSWLTEVAGLVGYGSGYAMTTEAYINGGMYFGMLFLVPQGMFASAVSTRLNKQTIRERPDIACLAFLIALPLMTLPRQIYTYIFRQIVYYAVSIFLLTKFIYANYKSRKSIQQASK